MVHDSTGARVAQAGDDFIADQLLVQARGGVSDKWAARVFSKHGASIIETIPAVHTYVVSVPAQKLDSVRRALAREPQFKSVSKNFARRLQLIPNRLLVSGRVASADNRGPASVGHHDR